jgi:two-component system copper resistance phosphate regulon response regulator CusR
MMRALVLEDDISLRGLIARTASRAGLAVDEATTIDQADEYLYIHDYDLLVLDRGVPDGDGLNLCRQARGRGFANSILIVTGLDDPQSTVDAFTGGADDYVGKPFDLAILEARIKALIRRNARKPVFDIQLGDLVLRPWQRRLQCSGQPIDLTSREFMIVETLMRAPGAVISRTDLLQQAWGEMREPDSNTIDVLMLRVRRKLAAAGSVVRIETVRGAGYRLSAEAQEVEQ